MRWASSDLAGKTFKSKSSSPRVLFSSKNITCCEHFAFSQKEASAEVLQTLAAVCEARMTNFEHFIRNPVRVSALQLGWGIS